MHAAAATSNVWSVRAKCLFFRFVEDHNSVVFLVSGRAFRKHGREKQKNISQKRHGKTRPKRDPNVIKPLFLLCGNDTARDTKPVHRQRKGRNKHKKRELCKITDSPKPLFLLYQTRAGERKNADASVIEFGAKGLRGRKSIGKRNICWVHRVFAGTSKSNKMYKT